MNGEERQAHLREWTRHRQATFEKAVELFGALSPNNLKQHQDYMKKAEKEWKRARK